MYARPAQGRGPSAPTQLSTKRAAPSPGTQEAPTLSLYLLEASFRAPTVPGGPRPCFRSCMVTSWLAARGQHQCTLNIGGMSPKRRPVLLP